MVQHSEPAKKRAKTRSPAAAAEQEDEDENEERSDCLTCGQEEGAWDKYCLPRAYVALQWKHYKQKKARSPPQPTIVPIRVAMAVVVGRPVFGVAGGPAVVLVF